MKEWDYYRRLVTTEYRYAKKYNAMLKAILKYGLEGDSAALQIIKAFDVDSAVGKQLDALGTILGVDRLLTFQPSEDSPLMDDDVYRFALKCKIVKNHWDGTIPTLYAAWKELLPEILLLQIQDLYDMTFNIVIVGNITTLKREMIYNGYVVPKPAGVRINVLTVTDSDGLPVFSYGYNTVFLSGYGSYWAKKED